MIDLSVETLNHFDVAAYIVNVSEDGQPVYAVVNKVWCQKTNCQYEDAVGKTALEIFGEELGQTVFIRHMEVIRTARQLVCDVRIPVDQVPHIFHSTMTPVLDPDGRVVQILCMIDDKTIEGNQLHTEEDAAKHLASDIERFFSIAAHDLRTPMVNIQNITDMLREDFIDNGDGKVELIDLLESVALKAKDLISDILAHADATNAVRSQEIFELQHVTKDIFSLIDPMQRHIYEVDRQWVLSDKTAIQIILRNLCDNAFKHAGQEQVRLSVHVRELDYELLEFSVQDNGSGFSNPAIAFLDGGELRMESGFGLLGVRRLILARGGRIAVENLAEQQGCIVSFVLPGRFVQAPEL